MTDQIKPARRCGDCKHYERYQGTVYGYCLWLENTFPTAVRQSRILGGRHRVDTDENDGADCPAFEAR